MTLGTTIKSARESSRFSIEKLAAETNIRIGLLTQMENNDFSGCGGDTYARGHIRNIANILGLDSVALLDQYNREHGVEQRRIQDLLVESNVTQAPKEHKNFSFKTLSLISVAILAVASIAQIVISNSGSDVGKPNALFSKSPSPTLTPSSSPSQSATAVATESASAAPTKKVTNTLKITATRGNAAIDIVTKDGHVYKGWLFIGESKEVSAQSRISIYVSNAGGVDITFNGAVIPSLGGQDEEVRRTFG